MIKEFVSLNELSKELNINKSKLSYYVSSDLLCPQTVVGRMQIFNRKDAIKTLNFIKKWQKDGLDLEKIKEKLTLER